MAKQAVLLLAHGTPETVEQIPEYLRNVVSGRPMPPHLVDEIQRRYALIGHSPLTEITLEQARLVEAELAAGGLSVPVYVAMRNWQSDDSRCAAEDARRRRGRSRGPLPCAAELAHQRGPLPPCRRGGSRAACASTSPRAGRSIRY